MNRIKHSHIFQIEQPVELLFPLFSAEGEKAWVPGWDYVNIMGRTSLREDDVFLTETHDHASTAAIWLVKQYEPERFLVQFYKVEPEDKVGVIQVHCKPLSRQATEVTVSYCYTALTDQGQAFVDDFTADAYVAFISEWEFLLNAHFSRDISG